MMEIFQMLLICTLLCSCQESFKKPSVQAEEKLNSEEVESNEIELQKNYTSKKWHFSLNYYLPYEIFEGQLPGEIPVVNVYEAKEGQEPPYSVHEKASSSYIAFLPKAYGIDGPAGERKNLQDWKGNLPLSFAVDQQNSYVYLLKNGKARGFSLRFYSPAPGWTEEGSIQIFYEVQNSQVECFGSNSDTKIMQECDQMTGDRLVHSGKLDLKSREGINAILESLYFIDPKKERPEISELIRLEQPKKNEKVSAPLQLKGSARGYWFFEGTAPFRIVGTNGKNIASGYLEAQENWMTEDFVPFEADISFKTPKEKRGFLELSRANASGKPEHDRILRIPILIK